MIALVVVNSGCKSKPATLSKGVVDIDGNIYDTITIGQQVWMVQNFKAARYNDGTPIPLVTDPAEWSKLTTPGYCWPENDQTTNGSTYGALYNWYAVTSNRLCPAGWHVPTNDDFRTLVDSLGGEQEARYKLQEVGGTHWFSVSFRTTNETGFTALPSGIRREDGSFDLIREGCSWWSTDQFSHEYGIEMGFDLSRPANVFFMNKNTGLSVRCIKDKYSMTF